MKKGLKKVKHQHLKKAAVKRIFHTQERAKERLDLELTEQQILEIGKKIRNGESTFVKAKSTNRTVHNVMYMGREFGVTYNKKYNVPETIFERKDTQSHETQEGTI